MKPNVDRIDFRPEQFLDSHDLEQASRRPADLLALHAARGHGVWGVAYGYLCWLDGVSVVINVGVALDSYGRPLLNSAELRLPPPAVPRDGAVYAADLVACWAPTATLPAGCRIGTMPAERADLRWELAGPVVGDDSSNVPYSPRVRWGLDVPIARVTATASAPLTVDTHSRPVAHALVRPKIATGHVGQATVQATGNWAEWSIPISTASAGFDPGSGSSPVYLASLDAHPAGDTSTIGSFTSTPGAASPPDLTTRLHDWVGPFVSISTEDHTGFTLRVLTATGSGWARDNNPGVNPVGVSWIGVDTSDPGPFAGLSSFLLQFATLAVTP